MFYWLNSDAQSATHCKSCVYDFILCPYLLKLRESRDVITYCTNFIAIAVSCAVPITTGLQVMAEDEQAYIGARWQLDVSRAIWNSIKRDQDIYGGRYCKRKEHCELTFSPSVRVANIRALG